MRGLRRSVDDDVEGVTWGKRKGMEGKAGVASRQEGERRYRGADERVRYGEDEDRGRLE